MNLYEPASSTEHDLLATPYSAFTPREAIIICEEDEWTHTHTHTHTHTWDRLYLQAWLLLARVRSIDGTIQAVLAAQEASREGNGGRNTGGRMKELRKRRERGEGNVCEKRMR